MVVMVVSGGKGVLGDGFAVGGVGGDGGVFVADGIGGGGVLLVLRCYHAWCRMLAQEFMLAYIMEVCQEG